MLVDIFSLGVIFFNTVTLRPPFASADIRDKHSEYRYLAKKDQRYWEKVKVNISAEMRDLFEKMVELDPNARIKYDDIIKHPWFNGETAT